MTGPRPQAPGLRSRLSGLFLRGMMGQVSPLDEYARRKADRERTAAAREALHVQLGNAKVALFLIVVAYTIVRLGGALSVPFYVSATIGFIALSVWHESVLRSLSRARAAVAFYADGEARLADRWMSATPSGERFRDPDHPYADDLDIFGPRSLFQLLSGCRTPMGEARLASWLLQPAAPPAIRDRQVRVMALRDRLDLRERIAVVNAGRRQMIDAARLITWAEVPPQLPRVRALVIALALACIATVAWYLNGGAGLPVVISLVLNVGVMGWLGKRANAMVDALAGACESASIELVANVVHEVEREAFDDEATRALAGRLSRASVGVSRLARIVDWADSRHTVFLRLAEIPCLFTLQVAFAAESWRAAHGRALADWIEAIAEIEALLSLAGYAYERPAYVFPEIVERDEALFDATAVAHPLLPSTTAVPNSLVLDAREGSEASRVLIVSGSNMSGKSTLMRTVGINVVLALAGAPVRAQHLRVSPLAVGTCLRHTDSLQERRSGCYTEALRIRRICDLLSGPLPVLFLFDELLAGTNSKDRRIAAEGVIRTMLARRTIGMVTTHDLSLTEIAAMFPGQVRNVHLLDKVENGQMSFDYTLKEGVIDHSNALQLMRMIGLDV